MNIRWTNAISFFFKYHELNHHILLDQAFELIGSFLELACFELIENLSMSLSSAMSGEKRVAHLPSMLPGEWNTFLPTGWLKGV